MVVFPSLLFGFVVLFPVFNTAQHDCQVGQVLHPHQGIFSQQEGNHCIILRCSFGFVEYIGEGCLNGDDCFPLGTGFENALCVTHNCTKNILNELTWDPIRRRCLKSGRCYSLGTTFENKYCTTLNCTTNDHDELHWNPISKRCLFGNECFPLGYTLQNVGCVTHNCSTNDRNVTGWNYISRVRGCTYARRCYPVGTTLQDDDCSTRSCDNIIYDNDIWLTTELRCRHNDTCYDVGAQKVFRSCKLKKCIGGMMSGVSWDVVETYCMAQGQCILRDVPRDFNYNGTTYHNCTCVFANSFGLGINCNGQQLEIPPDPED